MKASARLMEINAGDGDGRKIKVHASFLCMCGVLAQLSKVARALKANLPNAEEVPNFGALLDQAVAAAKGKNKDFTFRSRASVLAAIVPRFAQLVKSNQNYLAVAADSKAVDNVVYHNAEMYHKVIMQKVDEYMNGSLVVANDEVSAIIKEGQTLYTAVAEKHGVPKIFQSENLNKQAIQSLVADPSGQKLALFALKASESLSSIRVWLSDGVRKVSTAASSTSSSSLPSPTRLSMVAAMEKDIDGFQKPPAAKSNSSGRGDQGITLNVLQDLQINMTMSQAMVRDLGPGETRLGLVNKCCDMAKARGLSLDPALLKKAQGMLNHKGKP